MKEFKYNKKNNFIAGWYIDGKICDSLIKYHNKSKELIRGTCNRKGVVGVYKNIKDSIDLSLSPVAKDKALDAYLKILSKVIEKYKQKYVYADWMHTQWSIYENWNIQKYPKKGAFHEYHFERSGATDKSCRRHLVFMTYLNNIKKGGETEFFYQNLKVKPEKGLTLIWPADWTFTHRGIPSPKEIKYITTGWYSYAQ